MRGKAKKKFRDFIDVDSDDDMFGRSPNPHSLGSSYTGGEDYREVVLKPRNDRQRDYISKLENGTSTIVVATGAAGTGKTMIACSIAMQRLIRGDINKIVITRPMVNVDDDVGIGFLPGSLEEKCQPWLAPLTDVFYKYISPGKFQALLAKQIIEICPLEMMRGRSFEESFIIVDEAQNCSPKQMLMLLTRIGNGSKLVITGDPMQHDRPTVENGLTDFMHRLRNVEGGHDSIELIHFTEECIVRHPIIKKILNMYNVNYVA